MHRSPLAWLRLLLAAVLGAFLLGGPLHASETAATRSPAWAQAVDPSINLYRMSPTLYRSALPNAQSVALLQRLQVKTVVSFIKDDDRVWLGQAPVRVLSLPTHADRVDDAEVLSVLRQLQAAEREGPVLMHCKHGNNRTGLFAAMYRIVVQGWDKQAALEEMQHGGFGDEDDMRDASAYVRGADVDGLRLAMANGECSPSRFAVCHVREWMAQALDRP
ncbi:tyrosine phosphatase TpbA [Pseudomonas aeruginosa]|uniref:tyrosine phosphatase TpbA n=1 Tax=Pseudomonas aeruginosa TaxID=287 RepID=UPI000F52AB2E|nr:tyrosine phosphatase TpbA [Pseudomonas aeruginosa]MBH4236828.1 tyrosine phosphatase TpbA [Pseudomonas aeruginosa]MDU0578698.1 tyrosine phosphatase TpbA [Pseudomonas aeruginosa]MDU0717337.1 tyrosine phosphatase TpbA [Pseudomonas aeruginosa]RPT56737.1 protein-tyrosine-phosphatase [Pseudomonas aeruginosa]HCF1163944.1 tyrosine phosphatase TpbA [Pseudomonas aeruginosa]